MATGSLTLLAPLGLLASLLALLPLGVVALAFRRQHRVAEALGLEPMPVRRALRAVALPVAACLLLGIAVAQPVFTATTKRSARTSSEVVFVTDISRSMAASNGPGAPNRLDQAKSVVADLRAAVPDVPAGLSGLTDRILPYAFPTLDGTVFAETLARSVGIEAPPPQQVSDVATTFEPLSSLAQDGFYRPGVEHRTCVLVTDGETRSDVSWGGGCKLLVVKVGGAGDRIYRSNGGVDPAYRPETTASSTVAQLARASGGDAYSRTQVATAAEALRRLANDGPVHSVGTAESAHALAPWLATLALMAITLEILRRYLRPADGVLLDRRHRKNAAVRV